MKPDFIHTLPKVELHVHLEGTLSLELILELAEKYKLEKDQISLVGVGGGAASLIVYFSNKMGSSTPFRRMPRSFHP